MRYVDGRANAYRRRRSCGLDNDETRIPKQHTAEFYKAQPEVMQLMHVTNSVYVCAILYTSDFPIPCTIMPP